MSRRAVDVALRYLPALLGAAAIFAVSSMPRPPIPEVLVFWDSDKLLHAAAYCVLAVAVLYGARARAGGLTMGARAEAALAAALYGVTDEWHQSFVPGRSMSSYDLIADALGACLGAMVGGLVVGVLVPRARRGQPS
ncbi:MAG: VanZ family protein [Deltaproteobacteria bacterium]|nr:VanZ family protein [Deltaproteobacteria bacterium]